MPQGTIDSYDPDKQEGFIAPEGGGDRVPFALDAVQDRLVGEQLAEGEQVTYDLDQSDGARAVKVRRIARRGYG